MGPEDGESPAPTVADGVLMSTDVPGAAISVCTRYGFDDPSTESHSWLPLKTAPLAPPASAVVALRKEPSRPKRQIAASAMSSPMPPATRIPPAAGRIAEG